MRCLSSLVSALALALILTACGGATQSAPTPTPFGDAVAGQAAFASTCVACHGPEAKGLPNLGKDLTISEFVKTQTNDQLLAFLRVGRPASDPQNTVGIDMPPKGGNPSFTDQDLANIVAYLRTLNP
jgi:mono/diheme cytochrome c family protein